MRRHPLTLGLCALLLLSAGSMHARGQARSLPSLMQPFTARYDVSWSGIDIASASFSLQPANHNIYAYRVKIEPTGVASIFQNDTVTETSRFRLEQGKPQPLSYHYRKTSGNKLIKQQIIYFDWTNSVARTLYKGKRSTTPLTPRITDLLLGQLRLSIDMAAGHLKKRYPIVNKGKRNVWRMQNAGRGKINTEGGEYTAVKLMRTDPHSGKVATLWLAPRLDYLPVKMMQVDPDDPDYVLTLKDFHQGPG